MRFLMRTAVAVALAAAAVAPVAFAPAALAKDIVVHAGRLIDGVSRTPSQNMSILVRDGRIVSVTPGFSTPAGADIIDLSTSTVLPGLIDCHVHITASLGKGDPIRRAVTRTPSDDLIEAVGFSRDTLMAGFTSVRDVGADTTSVVALKRAIQSGVIPGPRLWVSGEALGPSGGHGDPLNGLDQGLMHPGWTDSVIDGPDEARRAVRRLKRAGADLIKIMPSGGVMSIGDDPTQQMMADDEIKAVVDTAHALGMKVAAHAHGKLAIDHAIVLGVDSIEHGTYGDAGSFKLYREHGTFFVPTLLVADKGFQFAKAHPEQLNPSTAEKALTISPLVQKTLHDAYASGVKIAFGTDTFGFSRHGENAQEFALMVRAGMTPMDAIIAATSNAAALLGAPGEVGAVQPQHYADLIAVSGDPLSDIRQLETVSFVMKNGVVVKTGARPVTP